MQALGQGNPYIPQEQGKQARELTFETLETPLLPKTGNRPR